MLYHGEATDSSDDILSVIISDVYHRRISTIQQYGLVPKLNLLPLVCSLLTLHFLLQTPSQKKRKSPVRLGITQPFMEQLVHKCELMYMYSSLMQAALNGEKRA